MRESSKVSLRDFQIYNLGGSVGKASPKK